MTLLSINVIWGSCVRPFRAKCLGCSNLQWFRMLLFLQLLKSSDRKDDCDLWKDGVFKSKVTRYLCYSRVSSTCDVSFSFSYFSYLLWILILWISHCSWPPHGKAMFEIVLLLINICCQYDIIRFCITFQFEIF